MKKIWIFLIGFLCGIVFILTLSFIVVSAKKSSPTADITMLKGEGPVISEHSFTVLSVLDSGNALAYEDSFSNLIVLFLCEDGRQFYDGQTIDVAPGQCVRQVGTYRYVARNDLTKTVPVVVIRDK